MLSRDVVQQQLLAVFGMYPDISLAVALRMNANITAPFHTVKLSLSTMVSCGMVMETKQKGRLPSIYRLSEEGKRYMDGNRPFCFVSMTIPHETIVERLNLTV